MRAQPVLKDTIDLLVTAAFVTDAGTCDCASRGPGDLDRLGQSLWDENYSSVSFTTGVRLRAPRYEWTPVAELMGQQWTDEQVLQVSRTRLYVEELCCHHDAWDASSSREVLEEIARWVAQRMVGYPLEASPVDAGVIEYAGISRLSEEWTREIGWRTNLSASAAAGIAHHGDLS